MRIFHLSENIYEELSELPFDLPPQGFLWLGLPRREFELQLPTLQQRLQHWTGAQLLDLHASDLLNQQLPSHFDYTSWYDLMVFRRLAAQPGALPGGGNGGAAGSANGNMNASAAPAPDDVPRTVALADQAFKSIDTSPVGFAVFDRVLITVHPGECTLRDYFASKLGQQQEGRDLRGSTRLPTSPAELMLRMVNQMVDSYLDLRRLLTRDLTTLQQLLLDRRSHFRDWNVVLVARDTLSRLEDICEDQRSAVQEWIDALGEWPMGSLEEERERELLRVRSRDVLEHVERVLTHVRRLESSAETSVQMHFSLTGERTNNIMRTLTVLTAIFLPLNLITGVFGMNFDNLPLIHQATGFWVAVALMGALAVGLGAFFWRKRYLGTS
ncbi:CorA family divalent cation transporter [Roseateles depolymerans]|uniref:Magnesium transport protein CorA n=1 Tax=Roseateles depolymerans TaxID=76731 RepID=A0A0U3N0S6_9BURK|nr:CorA family divalent cation transporter [Roseateles depolymerans]ALV08899.1 Magnesium transport protein CorA [Roseateles depolymerans]REG09439.1 Mg2+ and Co2+ transporter CorA [Roseateles depolymerans]